MSSKINSLLTQFLEYLEIEKNRSQLTVRNYDFYLKRFLEFTKVASPEEIDLEKVRQLLEAKAERSKEASVRAPLLIDPSS